MAIHDQWQGVDGIGLPNRSADIVTKSDEDFLVRMPKYLRIGYYPDAAATDVIVVEYADGTAETLSVAPGRVIHCRPVKVLSTGSTAAVVVYACI